MRKLVVAIFSLLILLASCSAKKPEVIAAFDWWSIYSPSRDGVNIDNDWALWGHNIRKAIPLTAELQAQDAAGKKIDKQYCFSSELLYNKLCSYIIDAGGKDFTIAPLDNNIVCQCEACRKVGNTTASATPAVWNLLQRLAKKFSGKNFYTIAYKTCAEPPANAKLTANSRTGIFLSAIKLPMRRLFAETEQFKKFDATLQQWKKVTDRIYIWDYNRNYDDYFTPYPCLMSMQDRLTYYRRQGIKGVFINDSGDCYASFGDLQSAVLAQMLAAKGPIDIETAIEDYCLKNYPVAGEALASWYLSMEKEAYERDHAMPFYAGIEDAEHCWLIADDFNDEWTALDRLCKKAAKPERVNLSTLLTALCMTRAELLRNHPPVIKEELSDILDILAEYHDNPRLQTYNEAEHKTSDYLNKLRQPDSTNIKK